MPHLHPRDKHKTEAEHNAELEAYQQRLNQFDNFQDRLDGIEVEDSGHTDVAPTITRRIPARPTLSEQDGDPNE